jgi:hypothetical protein
LAFGRWISRTKINEKSSNAVVYFKFCLKFMCAVSAEYFLKISHAIAVAKATMAMVGHFQPNPKKKRQGNNLQ